MNEIILQRIHYNLLCQFYENIIIETGIFFGEELKYKQTYFLTYPSPASTEQCIVTVSHALLLRLLIGVLGGEGVGKCLAILLF